MRILHLTLKNHWFTLTDSGDKPDEYREITGHWISRLTTNWDEWDGIDLAQLRFKQFDAVFARNGYNPKNPSWLRLWKGTSIGEGKEKWGAEAGKKYFVIKLGEKI